jgi:hypothetical protein
LTRSSISSFFMIKPSAFSIQHSASAKYNSPSNAES